MNEEENELGILPLDLWLFSFDGSYQSSKLIEAKEVRVTKFKYVMEVNFKDAPRVKESRIINSYRGEKYCSCYIFFKDARVRVTKHPIKIQDGTAIYINEYEVYGIKKTTSSNSGADRAKEIARKFDENKSSPKSYTSKYSKIEKNVRSYLKTGDYTLYSEASSQSEVSLKILGGVYYRVIKKGLSFTLIETDKGEIGYILTYDLVH